MQQATFQTRMALIAPVSRSASLQYELRHRLPGRLYQQSIQVSGCGWPFLCMALLMVAPLSVNYTVRVVQIYKDRDMALLMAMRWDHIYPNPCACACAGSLQGP